MLVAVLAGQCDVAGERRRQSAHEPAIPRVPRFVALRGQIGRMREMIGNRVLVTPIYPTVEAGLLGTVGSVKTRERDRYLRFCELYGTSGDRVTTAESRMLWAQRGVVGLRRRRGQRRRIDVEGGGFHPHAPYSPDTAS